jgi:hypothetical protein
MEFPSGWKLWKWAEAKVWQIVVMLRTEFLCVVTVFRLFTGMWRIQYAGHQDRDAIDTALKRMLGDDGFRPHGTFGRKASQ